MRLVGEEAPLCRVRGVKVRFNRLVVEGDRELVAVLAVEEVEVSLAAEGFGEGDAGLLFGGGGDMTGAVGSGLNDMHHTAST